MKKAYCCLLFIFVLIVIPIIFAADTIPYEDFCRKNEEYFKITGIYDPFCLRYESINTTVKYRYKDSENICGKRILKDAEDGWSLYYSGKLSDKQKKFHDNDRSTGCYIYMTKSVDYFNMYINHTINTNFSDYIWHFFGMQIINSEAKFYCFDYAQNTSVNFAKINSGGTFIDLSIPEDCVISSPLSLKISMKYDNDGDATESFFMWEEWISFIDSNQDECGDGCCRGSENFQNCPKDCACIPDSNISSSNCTYNFECCSGYCGGAYYYTRNYCGYDGSKNWVEAYEEYGNTCGGGGYLKLQTFDVHPSDIWCGDACHNYFNHSPDIVYVCDEDHEGTHMDPFRRNITQPCEWDTDCWNTIVYDGTNWCNYLNECTDGADGRDCLNKWDCNSRNCYYGKCVSIMPTKKCPDDKTWYCENNAVWKCEIDGLYYRGKSKKPCVGESYCEPSKVNSLHDCTTASLRLNIEDANRETTVYKQPGDMVVLRIFSDAAKTVNLIYDKSAIIPALDKCRNENIILDKGENECVFRVSGLAQPKKYTFTAGKNDVSFEVIKNPSLIILTNKQKLKQRFSSNLSVNELLSFAYQKAYANDGIIYDLDLYLPALLWNSSDDYSKIEYSADNSYARNLAMFAHTKCGKCQNVLILGDDFVVPYFKRNLQHGDILASDSDYIKRAAIPFSGSYEAFYRVEDGVYHTGKDIKLILPDNPSDELMKRIEALKYILADYKYKGCDLSKQSSFNYTNDSIDYRMSSSQLKPCFYGAKVNYINGSSINYEDPKWFAKLGKSTLIIFGNRENNPIYDNFPFTDYKNSIAMERNPWSKGEYAILLNTNDPYIVGNFASKIEDDSLRDVSSSFMYYVRVADEPVIKALGFVSLGVFVVGTFGQGTVAMPAITFDIAKASAVAAGGLATTKECTYDYQSSLRCVLATGSTAYLAINFYVYPVTQVILNDVFSDPTSATQAITDNVDKIQRTHDILIQEGFTHEDFISMQTGTDLSNYDVTYGETTVTIQGGEAGDTILKVMDPNDVNRFSDWVIYYHDQLQYAKPLHELFPHIENGYEKLDVFNKVSMIGDNLVYAGDDKLADGILTYLDGAEGIEKSVNTYVLTHDDKIMVATRGELKGAIAVAEKTNSEIVSMAEQVHPKDDRGLAFEHDGISFKDGKNGIIESKSLTNIERMDEETAKEWLNDHIAVKALKLNEHHGKELVVIDGNNEIDVTFKNVNRFQVSIPEHALGKVYSEGTFREMVEKTIKTVNNQGYPFVTELIEYDWNT